MSSVVVRRVLAWYADARRPLPWREPGTTPWGVLVSEFMCQQTQVDRVAPIWQEWMTRTLTRMNAAIDDLDGNWQETLAGVNAGSIAAAVALSYIDFRLGDLGWRNSRPQLTAWHAAFSKRDSMIKTALQQH